MKRRRTFEPGIYEVSSGYQAAIRRLDGRQEFKTFRTFKEACEFKHEFDELKRKYGAENVVTAVAIARARHRETAILLREAEEALARALYRRRLERDRITAVA